MREWSNIPASTPSASPDRSQLVAASLSAARATGKKVQMEMGGKNPMVVLDDADLENAVSVSANGAFFSTGQRCTASSRLIVTAGIHDAFVEKLTAAAAAIRVGDALDPDTQVGPVVDQSQLDQNLHYVALAKEGRVRGVRRRARRRPGIFPAPGSVCQRHQSDARQPRRDFRPVRKRYQGRRLRRGPRHGQRHRIRVVGGASAPPLSSTPATSAATPKLGW